LARQARAVSGDRRGEDEIVPRGGRSLGPGDAVRAAVPDVPRQHRGQRHARRRADQPAFRDGLHAALYLSAGLMLGTGLLTFLALRSRPLER